MGSISQFLGQALLNAAFRNVPFSQTAKVYLALYTSNPGDTNTGIEVSGDTYVRQEITFGAAATVNNKETIKNTLEILFPAAGVSWGTISHVGILDAETNGHLLYYGALSPTKVIGIGDQFKVAANNLVVDLD